MARLTKKDWALIREALQMLDRDWSNREGGHPEQERIDFLDGIALERSEKKRRRRLPIKKLNAAIEERLKRRSAR